MKAVIKSVNPKTCEKVCNGECTILLSKTIPKLETPFKCFIYEAKDKHYHITKEKTNILDFNKFNIFISRGKVIGEFVCDRIDELYQCHSGYVSENAGISRYDFFKYLGLPYDTHFGYDKKCYGWHISELKIYDKPKELREFTYPCKKGKKGFNADTNCKGCKYAFKGVTKGKIYCDRSVITAPQSWCYVEK